VSNKSDDVLLKSIDELEGLSVDIAKGEKVSKKTLEDMMSRGLYSLADHEYFEAYEYWANKNVSKAGQELKTLASNLDQSLALSAKKPQKEILEAVEEIRKSAEQMIQGSIPRSEDIDKTIEKAKEILKEISKLLGQ
jgi:ElaB/YqjD/DUF883 family membrane-anchored ribosome-binding protein